MEINGVKIDWLAQEVLLVLENTDNNISNTTEVREQIGLHGDQAGRRIKHRFDRLEEAGLVITEQPEPEENVWPPKQVMLTDDGRRVLNDESYRIEGSTDDETIREKIDRLETVVERLEAENEELRTVLGLTDDRNVLPNIMDLRIKYAGLDRYLLQEVQVDVTDYLTDDMESKLSELQIDKFD